MCFMQRCFQNQWFPLWMLEVSRRCRKEGIYLTAPLTICIPHKHLDNLCEINSLLWYLQVFFLKNWSSLLIRFLSSLVSQETSEIKLWYSLSKHWNLIIFLSDDNQLSFKFGFLFLYWYRYQIFYLLWVHIVHFNVILLIDFFSSLNLIFLFKWKYHFIQEYQYFFAILFLTKVNCICWQNFTLCFNYLGFFIKIYRNSIFVCLSPPSWRNNGCYILLFQWTTS